MQVVARAQQRIAKFIIGFSPKVRRNEEIVEAVVGCNENYVCVPRTARCYGGVSKIGDTQAMASAIFLGLLFDQALHVSIFDLYLCNTGEGRTACESSILCGLGCRGFPFILFHLTLRKADVILQLKCLGVAQD